MRKILWLLPLVLVLLSANAHAVDLTTCTTITEPGYYRLLNDVVVDGEEVPPCLILSSDVILDCDGHKIISGGEDLTVLQVGSTEAEHISNATVVNCKLRGKVRVENSEDVVFKDGNQFVGSFYIDYNIDGFVLDNFCADVSSYSSVTLRNLKNETCFEPDYTILPQIYVSGADGAIVNVSNVNVGPMWWEGAFIWCRWTCDIYANNVTIISGNDGHIEAYYMTGNIHITDFNYTRVSLSGGGEGEGGEGEGGGGGYSKLMYVFGSNVYIDMNNVNASFNAYGIKFYNSNIYDFNVSDSRFVSVGAPIIIDQVGSQIYNLRFNDVVAECDNTLDASTYFLKGIVHDGIINSSTITKCTYAIDLTSIYNLEVKHSKLIHNMYGIFVGPEKVSGQTIKFWDNLFNNTYNHMFQAYPVANDVYEFNTTLSTGVNVLGGMYIGGNYWGSPDGSGYSDMCIDEDQDGICDAPYVIVDDPEAGVYLADYLPLSPYQVQPFAPPQLPEVRILNPVSEVYYSAYVPVDVVVVYNQSRYDIESNISIYVDGLAYGRCTNCTELHKTIYVGGGEHVFEVYVPYKLYENGSLVNDSVLYANSTFFVQFVPLQTEIRGAPGGGGGAVLSLVDVEVRDASYITYQNECVQDYLVVDLKNAFDYCDVEIKYYGEGLPEGMIKYPSEYTLKPGVTYIPIEVCGVAQPDVYVGKVKVEGLCGSDIGDVSVTVKSQFSQLWEFITSPVGILLVLAGLWLWKERKG